MKISVIVPIYKIENYLDNCITSIVNQTFKNLEIILVDDGSPDNCPQICDEWAAKDNRIKVIHKKNEGLIEARKSGVDIATGDYITFVDGDDWIDFTMYEKVANAIDKHNPDCVITQFFYAFENKNNRSDYLLNKSFYNRDELENEVFPKMLFAGRFYQFGIYPNCWTKVFKKQIIDKYLFNVDSNIRLGEDIAFTYPCLLECKSLAFIDEPLYYYRQNPESMTASYDSRLYDIYLLPYKALFSEKYYKYFKQQLPYYLLYLTNFVIRNELSKANGKRNKEKKELIYSLVNVEYNSIFSQIDYSLLPKHTKLLAYALNDKSEFLLDIYCSLLRLSMKKKGQ